MRFIKHSKSTVNCTEYTFVKIYQVSEQIHSLEVHVERIGQLIL